RYNLINVLQETQAAASLEEAVFQAIELVNAYDREFKELYEQRQEVIGSLDPLWQQPAEAYIESMRNCIAASYYWQIQTPRYQHPQHFLDDLRR
ncbi:MAG TPA: hypothetical protein DCR93_24605, partial [Cytophagales bacterium]|nr:hypothetical protein [Cytophagales bacterium]